MFPNSFTPQEHHTSQRIAANHFSAPVVSYRPPETVVFPANSKSKVYLPESPPNYSSRPTKKNSAPSHDLKATETKKQKKRKPSDYFDMEDDDYLDSYYQDYDYEMENERPTRKAPKKTSHSHSTKYKPGVDPFGMLPSASDPEGFFAKAKDILRGGSYNRPSYSSSNPDYYPSYQSSKPYGESDLYNTQSYYDQENNGYPSKTEYYGSPGYDYDGNYGDKYGGFIPYPEKRKGSKYGPLAFALGLLPLGLLLASLVPTVVTIPVTTAVATGRRRKRSVQFVNPVLDTITEYGLPALEDPVCLKRIFCQVVRGGKQDRSSIVQKLYFKLAYVLDEKIADAVGLKSLLIAVKKDQCQQFECTPRKNSTIPKNK
ncbi:uncharacterized protein LOC129231645 [Uloborus diversus]|uniref:uncharacterized protein LOC129231645 n=1 Tax=Uloborus diversus TaxID=327109 RepID=UPI00240A93FF|nr:uncharacterized protein LOC129231645 [Uloborus diversus]